MSIFAKVFLAFQFIFIGNVSGLSNGCPGLWKSFGESCYLQVNRSVTWSDANYQCKRYGGQLVRIESNNVNSFLRNNFVKTAKNNHWIGLHRCGGSKWCFPDWTIASAFSNWSKGEPNNYKGQYEGCVEMRGTGYWNDATCQTLHPYICQRKTGNFYKGWNKDIHIYIKSEGCNDPYITGCGRAVIRMDGKDYAKKGRGYNIVVVNTNTGNVESSSSFDTYGSQTAPTKMKNFLGLLPMKRLVLMAIQDAGHARMKSVHYNALLKLGAKNPLIKMFRSSYAFIGWTGPGKINVVTQVQSKRFKGPSVISKIIHLPL